jgi:hypothetical protein
MIQDLVLDGKPTKPAIGQVHSRVTAQRPFRADREHIKIVRLKKAGQEVLARTGNFLVARYLRVAVAERRTLSFGMLPPRAGRRKVSVNPLCAMLTVSRLLCGQGNRTNAAGLGRSINCGSNSFALGIGRTAPRPHHGIFCSPSICETTGAEKLLGSCRRTGTVRNGTRPYAASYRPRETGSAADIKQATRAIELAFKMNARHACQQATF